MNSPGDDNPDALLQRVSLNPAYSCHRCRHPLVCCEKHLFNSKAGRRFFILCPECHFGFEIVSTLVVDKARPLIAKGACLFNLQPHDCDHAPYDLPPVAVKATSKKMSGKRKRPNRKNKRKGRSR